MEIHKIRNKYFPLFQTDRWTDRQFDLLIAFPLRSQIIFVVTEGRTYFSYIKKLSCSKKCINTNIKFFLGYSKYATVLQVHLKNVQ